MLNNSKIASNEAEDGLIYRIILSIVYAPLALLAFLGAFTAII